MTLLRTSQIHKRFGGVHALKGVDFSVSEGQALALVGENGAGKSTLMKILSGVYPQGTFEGDIYFNETKAKFQSTKDAEALGIAIIHQELNLFPELTVAENIFLSHLPVKKRWQVDFERINTMANELLKQLGVPFKGEDKVATLNTGNQQMVEIAKALSLNAKVLILDEPTSSLTQKEVESLFAVLKKLRKEGMALIYISHKLEEVFELCQDVTVLRDGASVYTGSLTEMGQKDVISHMVGRELKDLYPPLCIPTENPKKLMEVKGWNAYCKKTGATRVTDVNFEVHEGEILGLAGLMGAGRTDLFESLFGSDQFKTSGNIFIDGETFQPKTPLEAMEAGFALVTEDRKTKGLHLDFSIKENITLAAMARGRLNKKMGKIKHEEIAPLVEKLVKRLHIKIPSVDHAVKTLSGGNQQKVAIAKWLATGPKILFLDEPTRGIDVGAKFEIYSLLTELVKTGMGVVIASSELPELLGMCNRVHVMCEGEFSGEFTGANLNQEKIMQAAVGYK